MSLYVDGGHSEYGECLVTAFIFHLYFLKAIIPIYWRKMLFCLTRSKLICSFIAIGTRHEYDKHLGHILYKSTTQYIFRRLVTLKW